MKTTIFFIILLLISTIGCTSIEVKTTEQWEGHFTTVDEFKTKTENIKLDEETSIWVLSNHTLKRILKEKEQ